MPQGGMTVEELIAALEKFDKSLPVIGKWEGIFVPVKSVELDDVRGKPAVILDVDV